MRLGKSGGGRVIDPWLVVGSSLYWSAVVMSFSFGETSLSPAADPARAMGSYAFVFASILLFLPLRRLFIRASVRRVVALAMAGIVGLFAAVGMLGGPRLLTDAASTLYLFSVACQMVLWGFAYASLDKVRACQNVCCTLLTVLVVAPLFSLVYRFTGVPCLTCFLNIASLLVVASGRVFFSDRPRSSPMSPRRDLFARFVASRLVFGFVIGACIWLSGYERVGSGSLLMAVAALAMGMGVLACYLLLESSPSALMPSLLTMGIVLLYLPYLQGGMASFVSSAAGFVWLAWATLSAVQLSDLKETIGISEFKLCLADKGTLSLAIVAGVAVASGTGITPADPLTQTLVVTATFLLAFFATLTMAKLVGSRQEDEYLRRLGEEVEAAAGNLCASIALDGGLSEREAQVLALLADGYSRAHIQNVLVISEGTVKAHVAHIYQKLGVHGKDELLDLIESRRHSYGAGGSRVS